MGQRVVIASGCRTAIGTFGGALSNMAAPDIAAIVIKEAMSRAGVTPNQIEEVFIGNVFQAGVGANPARQAAMNAGIPMEVPATTVNVLCGSGLHSINLASKLIASGDIDIAIAGGMECMSKVPYLVPNGRFGYRMGNAQIVDSMLRDGLNDAFYGYHMGMTAENICDQWKLTRDELDEFAAWSQQKTEKAIADGKFKEEIVPIEIKSKKGTVIFDTDEGPRAGVTKESLSKLRPAFKEGGMVTAGNASGINDAAAAVVLMSEEKAKELGVDPLGYWVYGALAGCDPRIMGIGPVPSTNKVMKKCGYTIDDFELIEANEAFAAQSIAVARDLHFDMEKVNVNGGAIALGHPVGCTGARIVVSLLHEMRRRDLHKGLATLCVGGGMGCSAIIER